MRMEFHTSNNDKRYWTLTAIFYFNSQILKISALYYLYVRYKVASLHLPPSRQYRFTSVTNNDDLLR